MNIGLLLSIFLPLSALAQLVPGFYLYTHMAEQRGKAALPALVLSVSRPQSSGTEETLGTLSLNNWKPRSDGWPTLSLLFANEPDFLISAVQSFGIAVAKEQELLRASREQVAAMKEPPRPFYKPDRAMSMKRLRKTYAWVHSSADKSKSIWIERDTFLPLKIAAPCPEAVGDLSWAKSGDNQCEIEFRNISGLAQGRFQNARIALWKDGSPVLFFSFERISPARAGAAPTESKLSGTLQELAEVLLH